MLRNSDSQPEGGETDSPHPAQLRAPRMLQLTPRARMLLIPRTPACSETDAECLENCPPHPECRTDSVHTDSQHPLFRNCKIPGAGLCMRYVMCLMRACVLRGERQPRNLMIDHNSSFYLQRTRSHENVHPCWRHGVHPIRRIVFAQL